MMINEEAKKIMLSDSELKKYIGVFMLYGLYSEEEKDEVQEKERIFKEFNLSNYDTLEWLLNTNDTINKSVYETLDDIINDELINDTFKEYSNLEKNECKQFIYVLSRLLYMQDKFKDEEIGQELDNKIKYFIDLIRTTTRDYFTSHSDERETQEYNDRLLAYLLSTEIPQLSFIINTKQDKAFTDLWRSDINKSDLKEFLLDAIKNNIAFSNSLMARHNTISEFTNNTLDSKQFNAFLDKYDDQIKAIKEEYDEKELKVSLDEIEKLDLLKQYASVKDLDERNEVIQELNDKLNDELGNEFMNRCYALYSDYQETQEYKDLEPQTNEDILIWRSKAESCINSIENFKGKSNYDTFTLDYILDQLAYSDYQKEAYKTNIEYITPSEEKKKPYKKLTKEELKEKYKESTLLQDEELDYNRKWAKLDTSKVNTQIMDLRESIIKKVENNTNITNTQLKKLKAKKQKTKEDYQQIKDLEARLKEQDNNRDMIISELEDLKADKSLIEQQLKDISDARQIKALTKKLRDINNAIKEKENIINNSGVSFQLNTEGKMIYEKTNKRTKESYKLMLNADYDIQNFNSEGRNFLFYIPNIPNITNDLNEDFITIDIDDYLDFTGRETGNTSRIRKNLFNTLKEMRKETYDYNYIDDKGVMHEDSLVLIGDIKSTEYKGKATVKVQLGATFKDNLKEAFIKNRITKVDKDIFRLGQGKNNKAENMAKEIFIYLSRLARIEAKQGTINGEYTKDLHLDTIITHLVELNLINYDLSKYNEKVKEPLLYALNTGVELGLFTYKTKAFSYYDEIISKNNNGANDKDKISNFESGKDYGIKITLYIDKIDLDTNNKAHKTYTDYKRRNSRRKKSN